MKPCHFVAEQLIQILRFLTRAFELSIALQFCVFYCNWPCIILNYLKNVVGNLPNLIEFFFFIKNIRFRMSSKLNIYGRSKISLNHLLRRLVQCQYNRAVLAYDTLLLQRLDQFRLLKDLKFAAIKLLNFAWFKIKYFIIINIKSDLCILT